MKKLYFLCLFLCITVLTNAQFILTSSGLVPKNDTTKNYIVYEYENIVKEDLYKKVLLFLQKTYRSPDDVINEIPYNSMVIKGFQSEKIGIRRKSKADRKYLGEYGVKYNISYNMTLKFKDNKIRIDIPTFECSRILSSGTKARLFLVGKKGFLSDSHYIFSQKDGSIKEEATKKQIEQFFNVLCIQIKTSALENKQEDDW